MFYAKGRFALMRAVSDSCTTTDLPSLRLLFDDLHSSRCLRPLCERITLPVPVILKRLATAFRVLLRAMDFGMERWGTYPDGEIRQNKCSGHFGMMKRYSV